MVRVRNLRCEGSSSNTKRLKQLRIPRLPVNLSLTKKRPKELSFVTILICLRVRVHSNFLIQLGYHILGDKGSSQERLY